MKKTIVKAAAPILAAGLCMAMLVSPLSVLGAGEAAATPAVSSETGIPSMEAKPHSYAAYVAEHDDAPAASGKVTVDVGGTLDSAPAVFQVQIPSDGLYTVGMTYRAEGTETGALEVKLEIDGAVPFSEAEKLSFPRLWRDEEAKRTDGLGNEFAAKQIPYNGYRFQRAIDVTGWTAEPYLVFLTAGAHAITLMPVSGRFSLASFVLGIPESLPAYTAPQDAGSGGEAVVLEGEEPLFKNSYWLSAKADNASAGITPNSATKSLVNYIGGGNWKTAGETIVWETPELTAGYYQLGFSFRQSAVLGGKTYRRLTIDGETPFKEAEAIGFDYAYDWQQAFFADGRGEPYRLYLSAGKHEIGLTAVPGDILGVRDRLKESVAALGTLYIDMTMITGELVDVYRDYDLFAQIPDMQGRLESIRDTLTDADELLRQLTGQSSGSQSSVIKSMIQVISQMLDNRYTAHRYKNMYYDKYSALASELNEMRNMPLDIDKLVLTPSGQKTPFEETGFFTQLSFSVQKFFVSFFQDYNHISGAAEASDPVTVWVNWGRDQAQVLNAMAQSSFTLKTGIAANIQLVNASIVQAKLSGKGPDCILQYSRSEPVNLAMRGVLQDLNAFADLDEILARFQEGAELPYRYKDGLYALPDTQTFYLMFYRKDILEQLGLAVPKTWEDFEEVCKLLARRNLTAWIPNKPSVDIALGNINLFPTLLMQKGLSVYSGDGRSTNLSSPEVMVAFSDWTDYYRKLKLPKTLDFYNRFRTGTCPIGIETYVMYTTLKAAAPEIDGLWGVAPIPGTPQEDGTVSHLSAGGGTACAILKDAKNPQAAWEFLKWWTAAETQTAYSSEVESVLGPTGRVAVSNVEAFNSMAWDEEMLDHMLVAWEQTREIPEYPGSYYVARLFYQSFWNVVDNNQNPKDMLLKYSKEADAEIIRKWKQYENR